MPKSPRSSSTPKSPKPKTKTSPTKQKTNPLANLPPSFYEDAQLLGTNIQALRAVSKLMKSHTKNGMNYLKNSKRKNIKRNVDFAQLLENYIIKPLLKLDIKAKSILGKFLDKNVYQVLKNVLSEQNKSTEKYKSLNKSMTNPSHSNMNTFTHRLSSYLLETQLQRKRSNEFVDWDDIVYEWYHLYLKEIKEAEKRIIKHYKMNAKILKMYELYSNHSAIAKYINILTNRKYFPINKSQLKGWS